MGNSVDQSVTEKRLHLHSPTFFFSFYKSKHKVESLTYFLEHHWTPFTRQLIHTEEKALCQVQKLIESA